MLDRLLHNYRKEWLQDKHNEFLRKRLQEELDFYDEKLNDKNNTDKNIAVIHYNKVKNLIYLDKIKEALDCIRTILNCSFVYFVSSQVQYLYKVYFYSGFVKVCLKDYQEAMQDYDKANQLSYISKEWIYRHRICYEIEITNKKIYGVKEGCKKTAEYFFNMFKIHPDDFVSLYYCARANYFVDIEKSLQNYQMLLEDSLSKNDRRFFSTTRKMLKVYWLLAIIKCNLKIWQTKNINKSVEISECLKQAENEILTNNFGSDEESLKIFLNYFKSKFYKLMQENQNEKKYKTEALKIFKKELFSNQCAFYSDEQLNKVIKNKDISEQDYNKSFYSLFYNTNVSFKFFKDFYDKCNIKISNEYLQDLMCGMYEELEERLKYIIEKNNIDVDNMSTCVYDTNRNKKFTNLLEMAVHYGLSLNFIRYLVEEKKVNYKKCNNLLECEIVNNRPKIEVLKYIIKQLHFPKQEQLLFKVCERSNLEFLKYLIEEENYNPHIKNSKGETLLFVFVNKYNFEEKYLNIVKYLLEKCKVDINVKNNKGENFLSLIATDINNNVEFIKWFFEWENKKICQ